MLAYSSISHAGYVLIGLQAATDKGIAGSLFYLMAYTFMILGSFAIVTMVGRQGDGRHALEDYRGLARNRPGLALALTVFMLAQAGVPFTSGFLAKFGVIAAAVESRSYALAIIAMVAAVIAAFFYLRVIVVMYMSGDPDDEADEAVLETTTAGDGGGVGVAVATRNKVAIPVGAGVALGLCLAFTIGAGLLPEPLLDFARHATLLMP
jgi:NADH-quinone oxidoreductase subunit N